MADSETQQMTATKRDAGLDATQTKKVEAYLKGLEPLFSLIDLAYKAMYFSLQLTSIILQNSTLEHGDSGEPPS